MTPRQIEKAARDHADNYPIPQFFTPDAAGTVHTIAESSYTQGAQDAISQQWISVEERMPAQHDEVLVFVLANPTFGYPERYEVAYYDGEDWYTTHGEHIRPLRWMEIPHAK